MSRARPSATSSGVSSVASTTTTPLIIGRGPARAWPDADFDFFVRKSDCLAVEREVDLAVVADVRQQVGAGLLAEPLLDLRQQLAEPGAEQLEVGNHFVLDVLRGVVAELELLHVELFLDHRRVLFEPRLVRVSARITSTLASGWRTFSLAALRALRPSEAIRRTRFMRAESASSMAAGSPVG